MLTTFIQQMLYNFVSNLHKLGVAYNDFRQQNIVTHGGSTFKIILVIQDPRICNLQKQQMGDLLYFHPLESLCKRNSDTYHLPNIEIWELDITCLYLSFGCNPITGNILISVLYIYISYNNIIYIITILSLPTQTVKTILLHLTQLITIIVNNTTNTNHTDDT